MPVISDERMQERRESILDAASDVFSLHGFEQASTAEIARKAGVSEGLIYKYFINKRDLLRKVIERFGERFGENREAEVLAADTFAERLGILISRELSAMAQEAGLARVIVAEVRAATEQHSGEARAMTRRSRRLWSQIIAEAREAGQLAEGVDEVLAREAIWGAIEHLAWLHLSGLMRVNIDQTAERLTRMFVAGLAARA